MKALSIALLVAALTGSAGCRPLVAQIDTVSASGTATRTPSEGPLPAEITALQAQLAARPNWTEGWWELSTAAYGADRFQIAVPALEKVVTAAPQMGIAFDLLGLSEFEVKRYDAAKTHLERAASLNNSNDPEVERVAAYHLALLNTRAGDFDEASHELLQQFGQAASAQVTFALGLAALRVPLLPSEVDPGREAFVQTVGGAVARGEAGLPDLAALVEHHPEEPFLRDAYGLALERAGRPSQALATFEEQAKVTPSSPVPWLAIARVQEAQGHAEAALVARRRAIALESKGEASAKSALAARYAASTQRSGSADWTSVMRVYGAGNDAVALPLLKAWVLEHSQDGTAWAMLGLCEYRLHQPEDALLHLQRGEALGLRGDPRQIATAHTTAGLLLLQRGEFDAAADILTQAHQLDPDNPRIVEALGRSLLRSANAGGPGNSGQPDANLAEAAGRVSLLLRASRYDEAFPALKSLLQRYPAAPFLHYAYGTALIALSEFEQAAVQMRLESEISPHSALPLLRLASIALRQHAPQEALPPARRAVVLEPTSAEAHYLLGRALLETGADQTATAELEKARSLNPNSPEVHFSLARAYARTHRDEAAAAERATFARLSELAQTEKESQPAQGASASPAAAPQ